ncbi:FtsX-like permease family protein [Streptomyces sp. NPDC026673]|uniref:FtsX-like permease family protein n=1 Tax=Streptomyces sp. NPDC026673 TaxID=3155724 RepID=UPI0033DFABC7
MRATVRWALADLRTHRGQALSIVLATAGITVALLLSVALLVYAANPWQRMFTATEGAHVWLRTDGGADTRALSRIDGVTALSGPFRTLTVTAQHGREKAALDLRAAGTKPPAVGRPLMDRGGWLEPGASDGIVLERSVATALWAEPGDEISVTRGGRPSTVRVVGVAETAEPLYASGDTPGIAWASPTLVSRLADGTGRPGQTVGLRLKDPADTAYVAQRAVYSVGTDRVTNVATWWEARADAEGDNHLLGLLLGLFGLAALLAAAIAVTGGIATRVLAYVRDISVLKAVGFTPAQVVRMFLVQHAVLAIAGVLLGSVAAETLAPGFPGPMGDAMGLWQGLPEHTWALPGTAAATVLVIALATVLAAWRAGRVPPIPAARGAVPGRRRMSGAARAALRLGAPPALVLGCRGVLYRPARSAAAVARLALPILMITVALGAWATLDRFEHHPEKLGQAGTLTARPNGLTDEAVRQLLAGRPEIAAVHPGVELPALAPAQSQSVTLRGLGTTDDPYPFAVAEGRRPAGPDEALAGQGLLDALHTEVGAWVRVTVADTPHILHIVGRSIETGRGGRVLSAPLDVLRAQDPSIGPSYYSLVLRPGADRAAVRGALTEASHGALEVREVAGPGAELSPVRGVIIGLVSVLALIALAELSTAVGSGIRDHARDMRAYRAVGLTPQQTVATVVTGVGLIVLAAAVTGVTAGVFASAWLIDLQGGSSGVGAGIAQSPPLAVLLLMVCVCVAVAVAGSLLPAFRAAGDRNPRMLLNAR